jgi:hypothetical protein
MFLYTNAHHVLSFWVCHWHIGLAVCCGRGQATSWRPRPSRVDKLAEQSLPWSSKIHSNMRRNAEIWVVVGPCPVVSWSLNLDQEPPHQLLTLRRCHGFFPSLSGLWATRRRRDSGGGGAGHYMKRLNFHQPGKTNEGSFLSILSYLSSTKLVDEKWVFLSATDKKYVSSVG